MLREPFMDGNFHLRPATNADCSTVSRLISTVLQEHGLTLDPNTTDADLADLESSYFYCGGTFDVLVDSCGAVVGTVGLTPLGDGRCELRCTLPLRVGVADSESTYSATLWNTHGSLVSDEWNWRLLTRSRLRVGCMSRLASNR